MGATPHTPCPRTPGERVVGLAETDEHIDSQFATALGLPVGSVPDARSALTVGIMSRMGAAGRATPDQTPARLADRLERGRRRRFVGRAAELELFHGALDAPDEAFAVLFVHGPGGVGKSALLAEYTRTARAVGRRPVTVDGHAVTPTPAGFRAALAQSLGVPADAEVAGALHADTHVVLVDTFERLAPLEGWLRDRFLPALAAGVMVVIAGRQPPTPHWLADAGWRDLTIGTAHQRTHSPSTRPATIAVGITLQMSHAHGGRVWRRSADLARQASST